MGSQNASASHVPHPIEQAPMRAFQQFLRTHQCAAREYAAIEQRLAAASTGNDAASRNACVQAKIDFVNRIVEAALALGYPR